MTDQGPADNFPVTDWHRLKALCAGDAVEKHVIQAELFTRYRGPILAFLRRKGYSADRTEDLVQDFFVYCIEQALFERADEARGRFRNLMLTALNHYAAKRHRYEQAQIRRPAGGLVSVEALLADDGAGRLGVNHATPEVEFQRAWAQALLARVLDAFQRDFTASGRAAHYEIFQRCVVGPALGGAPSAAHQVLATELGLTVKEVGNRLVTAKRAYQRLLRAEIATYARSEREIDEEIRELFHALGAA